VANAGGYVTGAVTVTVTDEASLDQLATIDGLTSGTLNYTSVRDTAVNLATNTGGYVTGTVNVTVIEFAVGTEYDFWDIAAPLAPSAEVTVEFSNFGLIHASTDFTGVDRLHLAGPGVTSMNAALVDGLELMGSGRAEVRFGATTSNQLEDGLSGFTLGVGGDVLDFVGANLLLQLDNTNEVVDTQFAVYSNDGTSIEGLVVAFSEVSAGTAAEIEAIFLAGLNSFLGAFSQMVFLIADDDPNGNGDTADRLTKIWYWDDVADLGVQAGELSLLGTLHGIGSMELGGMVSQNVSIFPT